MSTFYYMEINNGTIVSYGQATDREIAERDKEFTIVELSREEYYALLSNRGNVTKKMRKWQSIENKLNNIH